MTTKASLDSSQKILTNLLLSVSTRVSCLIKLNPFLHFSLPINIDKVHIYLCNLYNPPGENEAYYLTEFKTSGQLQNKFLMQKLNADPVPTYLLPCNFSHHFSDVPVRAKYYEDPSLLFYDHRIPIEKDYNKIDWDFLLFKKNIKRLPEIYRYVLDFFNFIRL